MRFLLLSLVLMASSAFADSPFKNIDQLKSSLGFEQYYSKAPKKRALKIAVLDKGFYGYENEIGETLPRSVRYVKGPVENPDGLKVEHGLKMAQILTALMTDSMQESAWEPEMRLYNVFGYSNFKAAIDDIIERKIDLVLYSEVWEYGGNHDGKGFINAQVNRALKAGVLWVNAAGNFGQTTYNSAIEISDDDWVRLPDANNALSFRCQAEKNKKCAVKVVLSWNDFKDDVDAGTDKDLDLALADDLMNVQYSSALKQSSDRNEGRPGYSKYPREIIQAEVSSGTYYLKVKARSENFKRKDQLRITIDGDGVSMQSGSRGENLLNPADNPGVITVGASDSDRSSVSERMEKPDVYAPSSIKLKNGGEYRGSSNSAAIVAAGVAMLKTLHPKWDREEILSQISNGRGGGAGWNNSGMPIQELGFSFTGPGCFAGAFVNQVPFYIRSILEQGGIMVQTTAGIRVMTPFDPIRLSPNLRRIQANDMIVAQPQGLFVYPRYAIVPAGAVEIFQRPVEVGPCETPNHGGGGRGRDFGMPYPSRDRDDSRPNPPHKPD
jgi:hypothetical protein